MSTGAQIEKALKQVHSQESFLQTLLGTTLGWPTGDVQQIQDIAYGWSQQDLNAVGLERNLVEGSIWQIQPSATGQPWGVFVLEFKHEEALSPRRGLAGVLRKVLKGLVGARRKDPNLPSWKREHLLFICTYKWTHFRFAYYRSKPDDPRSARLTTFGWSPDTSNRTVVEFNLPALVWPEDTSDGDRWIAAWAKAFDKEPLTKDFFKRFDSSLDAIKADLQKYQQLSSAEAYTQSQLLLERLIFLYFLQNRGWLNQDRRYLPSRLGEHTKNPQGFSYYQDFLDKLFWTLSTAPLGAGRLPGIPFLNGGLFDDDEFVQPANLRKTTPPLKVRNQSIQYVFQELLEAFNFTVTEDTPLNQEVAVDPEMLGKVFESIVLHAEAADPDAIAPDKRKATGSYYTPRIVVHFICQEALYQYLLNHLPGDLWGPRLKALFSVDPTEGIDEEAKQFLKKTMSPEQAVLVRSWVLPLKCCDPAVGSGAFPVGLMHELVNLRRLLETVANGYKDPVVGQGSVWLHQVKAQIVENSLFGVDVQQQAIEICRLRLWLSLIVDYDLGLDPFTAEKSQFSLAIDHISQLPNLEMNFRRGDSLHDHISGVPVVILPARASRHTAEFGAIAKLGAELHKAKKAERKKKLRLDILEKRLGLSRKILDEELNDIRTRDSSLDSLFGIEESNAKKRERNQREIEHLEEALAKVGADQKSLDKLRQRDADSHFYPKLRKLEGADFDSPFNFAWHIDFPGVFADGTGGFDIIVGNPPFVTARNPTKRDLWRQRWTRSCAGKYHMLCPFFELSFDLLKKSGELGFIVSNAFATRDFGQQLVEKFFPGVQLQKVVDCSGLLFPGHGTPTFLVFGTNTVASQQAKSRLTAILPGGGDLRTPPEDSPLWRSISLHHDQPGYLDSRIAVADRPHPEMLSHPWNLDVAAGELKSALEHDNVSLSSFLPGQMGVSLVTLANEIYAVEPHVIRRAGIPVSSTVPYVPGENVRNWSWDWRELAIFPYEKSHAVRKYESTSPEMRWLRKFRPKLESRIYFGKTQIERGLVWYEYGIVVWQNCDTPNKLIFPDLSTHCHFVRVAQLAAFNQHTPILALPHTSPEIDLHLVAALVNSSAALFWLKQVSYNRGAGEDEHRDRFEFMGGKVQELPVPVPLALCLKGNPTSIGQTLAQLGQACWSAGQKIPQLNFRRLFTLSSEAYGSWNQGLPHSHADDGKAFWDTETLQQARVEVAIMRDSVRNSMIAFQEEMDWLIYAAYGLLPAGHPAVRAQAEPEPLARSERPFCLWEMAGGDYSHAVNLIPKGWSTDRCALWQARLGAIRDNDHIRRIEQPVYKRRWDEQWKVGNEWRCGKIAYAAGFIDAFEWWLKEKAEWWLEHKRRGGPVELGEWTQALWKDNRIQAAWPVAVEQYAHLEYEKACEKAEENGDPVPPRAKLVTDSSSFLRKLKEVVEQETVPEGLPFGVDYDELAKKLKQELPAKLKKARGKLNVPRERFHSVGPGQYKWAGLQFK